MQELSRSHLLPAGARRARRAWRERPSSACQSKAIRVVDHTKSGMVRLSCFFFDFLFFCNKGQTSSPAALHHSVINDEAKCIQQVIQMEGQTKSRATSATIQSILRYAFADGKLGAYQRFRPSLSPLSLTKYTSTQRLI